MTYTSVSLDAVALPEPSVSVLSSATNEQVQARAISTLGLDADALDLEAPEAIAALLRRTASFAVPCSSRVLREYAIRALRGLVIPAERANAVSARAWESAREAVAASIESLIAYGDFLELPVEDGSSGRALYLAPPTFVQISPTVLFLIGGRPDAVELLPGELRARVQYISHTRQIIGEPYEALHDRLRAFGLIDLPQALWLAPPRRESATDAVARADRALASKPTHGEVAGLAILDPDERPTYYTGRWRGAKGKSGRFVARREQQYGADLWAYVEVSNGEVIRLLDLPFDSRIVETRGCDEAWQLQLAIDAVAAHPQQFRLRTSPPAGSVVVDFFSPIPQWARRKFDILGEAVSPNRSLLSYRFPQPLVDPVRRCLEEELWLVEAT